MRASLLALSSVVVLAPSIALATTKARITVTCPVCQEKVEGWTIMSTNNAGGQDRDFLEWAGGDQPIIYYPITCTSCWYSGYQDDFAAETKVPEDVAKRIRDEQVLKPIEEPVSGPPEAWVRYDLVAQTYTLTGKGHGLLAWQYLRGAWAVRIEKARLAGPTDRDTQKAVMAWMDRWEPPGGERKGPAQVELLLAAECETMLAEAKGEDGRIPAMVAILLYRTHGENTAALRVLAAAKVQLGDAMAASLQEELPLQIEQERALQRKALAEFEAAVPKEKDPGEQAGMTYLCGELCRRLEEWDRARAFYDSAQALPGAADWLKEWCREQAALIPAK